MCATGRIKYCMYRFLLHYKIWLVSHSNGNEDREKGWEICKHGQKELYT